MTVYYGDPGATIETLSLITMKEGTIMYEEGCYFDSHHGIYIPSMVVRFAMEEGFPVWAEDDLHLLRSAEEGFIEIEDDQLFDQFEDLHSKAIDWLNEVCSDDDHYWDYDDGDFGYWRNENDN